MFWEAHQGVTEQVTPVSPADGLGTMQHVSGMWVYFIPSTAVG